jgi:hypothetical protein
MDWADETGYEIYYACYNSINSNILVIPALSLPNTYWQIKPWH